MKGAQSIRGSFLRDPQSTMTTIRTFFVYKILLTGLVSQEHPTRKTRKETRHEPTESGFTVY